MGVMMEVNINIVMKRIFKDKIEWFSCNYDKEIAGWITGTIEGNSIILEDLLIPEQEADSGGVDMTGKQLVKLRKEYGKKCESIIGEWHSHSSMGSFWSSTDEEFIKQFSEPREICIFIVSSKETHKIRVEIRKPFTISLDDLEYEVEEDDKLAKKLQKELDKKVTIPIRTQQNFGGFGGYGGGYGSQQTLSDNKKENNAKVGRMMKFYNGINKVEISGVPSYYAEDFFNQFNNLSPKIDFNNRFGDAKIEIAFKNKEEAINEMKEIRNYFVNMLEELEDINQTYT